MKKWETDRLTFLKRVLLYFLPIVVFFSYLPVISLGSSDTMNFELSLPLIWLAIFGIISLIELPRIFKKLGGRLFFATLSVPLYAFASVLWSANPLRGLLVAGVLGLIWLSVINIVSCGLKKEELGKIVRVYLSAAVAVSVFCILQCFLDVFGVQREMSGLCLGCKYESLGFPHPNGFTIEPQFMGNLLIAPALISLFDFYNTAKSSKKKKTVFGKMLRGLFLNMTLFVCFSRGALFASYAAVILFVIYSLLRRRELFPLIFIGVLALSGVFGLLLQGTLAEISPTEEGFGEGVARSINHLSLGKIDVREKIDNEGGNQAIFSGYIAESTDIRLNINEIALSAWQKTPSRMIFGAGLGAAGTVMAEESEALGPKEIVQNQYTSILLELGIVGWGLIVYLVVVVFRRIRAPEMTGMIAVAYLFSLGFFAGLTNVLHIYLMTPLVGAAERKRIVLN